MSKEKYMDQLVKGRKVWDFRILFDEENLKLTISLWIIVDKKNNTIFEKYEADVLVGKFKKIC